MSRSSSALDPDIERNFHRALTTYGPDILLKIKEVCLSKYDFEDDERSALIKAMNHMRVYAEKSKANLEGKLDLY
jgi:hypothetical protein